MTLIKDLIELPDQVFGGDFVHHNERSVFPSQSQAEADRRDSAAASSVSVEVLRESERQ